LIYVFASCFCDRPIVAATGSRQPNQIRRDCHLVVAVNQYRPTITCNLKSSNSS